MSENVTEIEKGEKMRATYADGVERRILSYIVNYPQLAFKAIEEIGITREYFSNAKYASAFSALLDCGADVDRMGSALARTLGDEVKGLEAHDEFMNCGMLEHKLKPTFVEFAQYATMLGFARKTMSLFADTRVKPFDMPGLIEQLAAEMRTDMCALERFRGGLAVDVPNGPFDGTVPTPEELMDMPGFVNALAAYSYATAPRPNRVLSFAGALAMLAHLVARKFTDKRKTMTNLYLVALANSGVGKDQPRKVNKQLGDCVEIRETIAEQVASGEGIEDALFEYPAMLFQMDEFATMLNTLKDKSALSERLYTYLLTFFSESGTSHALRRKAMSQETKQSMAANPTAVANRKALKIYNPSLVLFATAIPDDFYGSLTLRALENGMLARCFIFEAGNRGPIGEGPFDTPIPNDVVLFAKMAVGIDRERQWGVPPKFNVVPDGEGVAEVIKRIEKEADAHFKKAESKNDRAGMAVWSRGGEMTNKLALLYALSENISQPVITVKGFEWAWKLTQYSSLRMLAMADAFVASDREDADCKKVMAYLNKQPGRRGARGVIAHALHLSSKQMDAAETTLADQGQIEVKALGKSKIYRVIVKAGRR